MFNSYLTANQLTPGGYEGTPIIVSCTTIFPTAVGKVGRG